MDENNRTNNWPVLQDGVIPEGQHVVAAFLQPLPMDAAAKLCRIAADSYGADSKVIPCGDWLVVTGNKPTLAPPERKPKVGMRVCEVEPQSDEDGTLSPHGDPDEAAAWLRARHPEAGITSVWVWAEGSDPADAYVSELPCGCATERPTAEPVAPTE